jgi:DNA repair exonuclease SbcCD nuclease subunit
MRLVHLSDLHLGFRQFQRTTPAGINQREADVAKSFTNAVDKVIGIHPDLLLVAGDVFHAVRPTNPALIHAFTQFARLTRELPESRIVIVAGNHELPRSSEQTCILRLFTQLGVHVADTEHRRLRFPDVGLSVLAVPERDNAMVDYAPDPTARYNVLLAHGEVAGTLPDVEMTDERASIEIPQAAVESADWQYVALGHYHVYKRVGPNAYYSGAIDYTSSSVWQEVAYQKSQKLPGKGFIERDLESGKQTFHTIDAPREFIDLPRIDGRGIAAADIDRQIAERVAKVPGGVEGKVVRLVVRDVPRHVVRELDHRALREFQRQALHFHLDTRRPEAVRLPRGSGAPGRRPSLADTLRESLRSRVLTGEIDREQLIDLGMRYLAEAEQVGAIAGPSTVVDE